MSGDVPYIMSVKVTSPLTTISSFGSSEAVDTISTLHTIPGSPPPGWSIGSPPPSSLVPSLLPNLNPPHDTDKSNINRKKVLRDEIKMGTDKILTGEDLTIESGVELLDGYKLCQIKDKTGKGITKLYPRTVKGEENVDDIYLYKEQSKDTEGKETGFSIEINVDLDVYENSILLDSVNFQRSISYNNLNSQFELKQYENVLIKDLSDQIILDINSFIGAIKW